MNSMLWVVIGVLPLSMDQAVDRALKAHLLLQSSKDQITASYQDIQAARASFFPQLSVRAQYSHSTFSQSFTQLVPVAVDPNTFRLIYQPVELQFSYPDNYQIQATLSQILFDFGKTSYAYWAQKKAYQIAQIEDLQLRKQVELQTHDLYLSALLAIHSRNVLQQLESTLYDHYQTTKQRYEAGLASELDVLRSEIAWRNTLPQVQAAEIYATQTLDMLRTYLNVEDSLILTDSLLPPDSSEIARIQAQAHQTENRLDLQKIQYQRAQLQDLAKLQRTLYFPTIAAFASYNLNRPLGFENTWGDFTVFGIQLQWSLFDGGKAWATAQATMARQRALRHLETFQRALADVTTRTALHQLDQTLTQLESSQRALEVAERTLKLAQTQVDAGLLSEVDFQDIQTSVAQARLNWYRAVYTVQKTLLTLEASRWGVSLSPSESISISPGETGEFGDISGAPPQVSGSAAGSPNSIGTSSSMGMTRRP